MGGVACYLGIHLIFCELLVPGIKMMLVERTALRTAKDRVPAVIH